MSEFRFAEPEWIHLQWGVLAFSAWLLWLESRRGGALSQLVSSALQDRLVRRPTSWRRRARIVLLGLSGVCLVLALMRPQWGIRHVAAQRVGAEIMIALDVSKSMLAEDVAPNRLDRAKAEIVDLLGYLEGDQVGLIAFAGRATVIAPLTPDFSFLRLVLDGVGPHTIARGGTRLEEPIRKAVKGFGASGDASRAILLITDGEDQDSFPLDAAKAAAEAGVIIIAIGFGDESGSEIYLTDRETGARQLIRDGEGRPVRSRLDGDLLRDMAMATGGAYVPAGTGVLDLESIYRQHIEGLMVGELDPRGRTVRDEAYQWAVLVALVFLVSSVVITSGTAGVSASLVLFVWFSVPASVVQAAPNEPTPPAADSATKLDSDNADPKDLADPGDSDPAASETDGESAAKTPREIFNLGVAALEREEFDEGARYFERARREASDDGELRFAASYDLALAFASRGGQLESENPADALQAYYTAADWFRDAISQRPEHEDSRANLEVALRSALLVADRLARKPEGIRAALEELAGSQRELVGDLAGLLQLLADDPEIFAADRLGREFRVRATSQRALLSDAERLAREIDTERELIANKPDAERAPEDQMRATQFEAVLHYLHRAREKMGQARRQLRQRQGGRAYRRGSDALDELKRALDQLRSPAQLLEVLIRDAKTVTNGTGVLASSQHGLSAQAAQKAPVWLTPESLQLDQRQVVDRIEELDQRLLAGLNQELQQQQQQQQQQQPQPQQQQQQQQPQQPNPDPAAEEILASIRDAEPFVARAHGHFEAAVAAIESSELQAALPSQIDGIVALGDARERFLDLSGLIEAAYTDEKRIGEVLAAIGEQAAEAREEFLPTLREVQARNIDRAERLGAKLETEAAKPPPTEQADPDADAIRKQRFELAGQLLTLTLAQMDEVQLALGSEADRPVSWSGASEASAATIGHLESLRRLFLSITELLRDAIREQLELTDATQDAAALASQAAASGSDAAAAGVESLSAQQQVLAIRAGQLADGLEEQSNQSGGVLEEEADGKETSQRLRAAGEHVLFAQTEMEGGVTGLNSQPPEFESTHGRQAAAVAELELALAELVPPEERNQPEENGQQQQDQQQQEQQQQQQEQQQQQQEQQQEQPEPGEDESQQPNADPAQMLQEVRDREAQRRRHREQRGAPGYETVERDW